MKQTVFQVVGLLKKKHPNFLFALNFFCQKYVKLPKMQIGSVHWQLIEIPSIGIRYRAVRPGILITSWNCNKALPHIYVLALAHQLFQLELLFCFMRNTIIQ